MFIRCCRQQFMQYRFQHSKVNHNVCIDPGVEQSLLNEKYSHKQHPGRMRSEKFLPHRLHNAMKILCERYPSNMLKHGAQKMYNYLWSRHLPAEEHAILAEAAKIKKKFDVELKKLRVSNPDTSLVEVEEQMKEELYKKVKRKVYNWTPMKYDGTDCFRYMAGRTAFDYSSTYRVLHEIMRRDPDFKPQHMFDFGSGIGSSVWAVNAVWENTIIEHVCVDNSTEMNTIARLLLQDGAEDKETCFENVYFRQNMPSTIKNDYDLVISSHALMEIPSEAERLKTLAMLWEITGKYLVIVENGTNAGFQIVSEARNLIHMFNQNEKYMDSNLQGHVLSPCPHDSPCPRIAVDDGTPCNFQFLFKPFFPTHDHMKNTVQYVRSKMSYVVLKKGKKNPEDQSWPRIVRQVKPTSRHVSFITCSPSALLETTVITQSKHGRHLYKCAKNCEWGDCLPVQASEENMPRNHKIIQKDTVHELVEPVVAADEHG